MLPVRISLSDFSVGSAMQALMDFRSRESDARLKHNQA